MGSVIALYDRLRDAPDEQTRARAIAEAFEQMEQRYPEVTDLVTGAALRETELRLQKEIEQLRGEVQKDIEQLRGEVQKDIEQLRGEMRAMEGRLRMEIEQLRGEVQKEIATVRVELGAVRVELVRWMIGLLVVQASVLITVMRFFL